MRCYIVPGILLVAALLLPPRELAVGLAGSTAPHLAAVVTGAWIFKLGLGANAIVLATICRWLGDRETPTAGDRETATAGDRETATVRESGAADGGRETGPGAGDTGTSPMSARTARVVLGAIVGVAAAARLAHLGAGLWVDEIHTLVAYAWQPLGVVLTSYQSQNQHLLYSLLARLSWLVSSDAAWAVRLPAVAFGVASLWALYRFGLFLTGRREALLATALVAFSYHHVWFSQNARGYSGMLFWTLAGSILFLRLVEASPTAGWKLPVGYGVTMALALATQLTAAFVLVGHALIWAWSLWADPRRRLSWRGPILGFALATTLGLQLYALVLPQVAASFSGGAAGAPDLEWQRPGWFLVETLRGLERGVPGGWPVLLTGVGIGLVGLVDCWRRSRTVTAVMLVPGLLTAAAILLLERNLWPRYFFFCLGFAALIVVRGMVSAVTRIAAPLGRQRAHGLATLSVVVLVAAGAIRLPRAWGPKQDFEGARAFVEETAADPEAVVTVGMASFPYQEYLETGWQVAEELEELLAIEQDHARTWVVYTFPTRLRTLHPRIWERLGTDYRVAAEFPGTVGDGAVVVAVNGQEESR